MSNNVVINNGTVVSNGEVIVNGVKLPPCPSGGYSCTVINDKVYIDGFEFVNGKWKKTLRALWHKLF